ncbi:hypothetical protein H9660_08210 [Clostridium sp. Sa3CUN1]|uniref:N-acetyltransferase domain-containing protein n=1 Tax=Clostridium gallinarum TaxID=2762246 RepID=A0ABR8Q404_9CLOT|nr:hypothetical protein [Clostridium gallinarum]MBD7915132.1 hypothetical protein [Clostridium gallinarum]
MLRTINEEDISIAIDFAWKLSQKLETSSYPLYKEKSKHEDNIEGSIFIKKSEENTSEIFGLSVSDKYKGKGIEEILLSKSLEELFKYNPLINKTIFFIDECEIEDLNMVQKIGFNYFSSYRCYEVWL